MNRSNVAIRYTGHLLDARESDDKICVNIDGHAVLSRELHLTQQKHDQEAATHKAGVTGSLHVVPRPLDRHEDRVMAAGTTSLASLLFQSAQTNHLLAPTTFLSPGIHVMCHVHGMSDHITEESRGVHMDDSSVAEAKSAKKAWLNSWQDLWDEVGAAEEAERLAWQIPCLSLLRVAAASLDAAAFAAALGDIPKQGWARIPCDPARSPLCWLLEEEVSQDDGRVMWYHVAGENAEAIGADLAERLLPSPEGDTEAAHASVVAKGIGHDEIEVSGEAHRVLHTASLSEYDMRPLRADVGLKRVASDPEGSRGDRKDLTDVDFVDLTRAPRSGSRKWQGFIETEGLPGGGLHRHVRVKVDLFCTGLWCPEGLKDGTTNDNVASEWCEMVLSQHVHEGAFIDVDEVKARNDYNVSSSFPTRGSIGVETFGGEPIDVELPASVSGQHVVTFSLWIDIANPERGSERGSALHLSLSLPIHLRYPAPGCERRDEDCEEYAWIQVPPPLVSIRCGAEDSERPVPAVFPLLPPRGTSLRVPRGLAWHRDLVAWGTIAAVVIGTLYTLHTLWTLVVDVKCDPSRTRSSKDHVE